MIDLDTNPFPCGISDEELDPPDIYGGGEKDEFLTLPEGPDMDDDFFDIESMPLGGDDFDIDDMPLGDDPEPEPEPEPVPEITIPPRREAPPAEEAEDDDPIFSPDDLEDTNALFEELSRKCEPPKQPNPEPLPPRSMPEPDPGLPWITSARARFNAIMAANGDAEDRIRAEINDIAKSLEGGRNEEDFPLFAGWQRAGLYTDNRRAGAALNFFFQLRFATIPFDPAADDIWQSVYLWRIYGPYIPPACWRTYADQVRDGQDDISPRGLFRSMRGTYAKKMADVLCAREREWEQAAAATERARDQRHGKSLDKMSEDEIRTMRACEDAQCDAYWRTAYMWQRNLCDATYYYKRGKTLDDMWIEYKEVTEEIRKRLEVYL